MKSIEIIRFGKLLPVTQTGNFLQDGYHNAPAKEGYYCFNKKFMQHFLVGNRVYERDFYQAEIVGGTMWVHLTPKKRNMILAQHGSWNLIRVEDYHKILKSLYNSEVTYYKPEFGGLGKYAKDHLEFFCTEDTILKNVKKRFNKYKNRGREKSLEIEDLLYDKECDRFEYYMNFNRDKQDEANSVENDTIGIFR